MNEDNDEGLSRRTVLKALAAATICPVVAGCEFVEIYDDEMVEESSFSLDHPGLESLEEVGATACWQHGAIPILLVRANDDEILAFDRICPHANQNMGECDANPRPAVWHVEDEQLECLHHHSVFDRDGNNVDGPAIEPVPTFDVDFDPDTGQGTIFSP